MELYRVFLNEELYDTPLDIYTIPVSILSLIQIIITVETYKIPLFLVYFTPKKFHGAVIWSS